MNRQHIASLLVVLVLLCTPPAAMAIDAPHDLTTIASGGKGYTCSTCHIVHRTAGTKGVDNICQRCHQPGRDLNVDKREVAWGDGSNLFGNNTTAAKLGGRQSSHAWTASDTVPAAGSQAPTSPLLNKLSLKGRVSCVRCHAIHNSANSTTTSKPYIRMMNDRDQLCLDCHRSRNTRDHKTGTHPVSFTYTSATSKARLNPSEYYYPTPQSANPANPTAAMKFPKGLLVCSTCHRVHAADSDSATFGSMSSAQTTQPNVRKGLGVLLRTDMRGATPNAVNICTNCHAGKTAHNLKNQDVQCADCHGAHVEYDPLDPINTLGRNVYLVNRYMNMSSQYGAVRDKRAFFRYTGATTTEYKNGAGTGVCQACHVVPTGGSYPAQHSLVTAARNDCVSCHSHNGTAGSFSGGCSSCHGYPPKNNVAGGPNGYAVNGAKNYATSGVFKNESTAGHPTHAGNSPYGFVCNECHKGYAHDTGTFQDVFIDKTGIIASTGGANPTYATAGNGTCNTTYCHSNGAPRSQTIKYKSPTWASSRGTIVGTAGECAACHNGVFGAFNNMSTNAHFRHASNNATTGKGYGCAVCHAATVSSNTVVSSKANHVNGAKNITFSGTPATGTTWDTVGATCTTSACHSDGKGGAPVTTPVWTNKASGACGACHYTTPTIGGAAVISTGAHFAHFSSSATSYGPMLTQKNTTSCATCHTYTTDLAATHVNAAVDAPLANCTTSCHKQLAAINPAWTSGPVTCESCHTGTLSVIGGITAPDKTSSAALGHGKPAGANKACLDCHDRNKQHINSNTSVHYTRLSASLTGPLNTECNYCHNNAAIVANPAFRNMTTHVTVDNGPADSSCSACHDVHGTSNRRWIKAQIIFNSLSAPVNIAYINADTDMVNNITKRGLCQVCHTKTTHYRRDVAEGSHPTTGCLSCHDHNAAGFAFKPNGDCDACHGYPPMPRNVAVTFGRFNNWTSAKFEDYSGGGGAHAVAAHIPKNAKAGDGWAKCAVCHNSGVTGSAPNHNTTTPVRSNVANVTIAVDPKYKFSAGVQINYSGAKLVNPPSINKSGSCTNLSCHFGATPKWGTER